jgi:hypothetical protein
MFATLYQEPNSVLFGLPDIMMAASASALIAACWWMIAFVLRKKKGRIELPTLFWCFAGAAVGLFVFGLIYSCIEGPVPM